MTHRADTHDGVHDGVLYVSRRIEAPREKVFQAFTKPELYKQWFGAKETTMTHCKLEPVPGGELYYNHKMPNGEEVWIKGEYVQVLPDVHIVFRSHFSDADGGFVEIPPFPAETQISITLMEEDGTTLTSVEHQPVEKDQGEWQGWSDSFDRLEELLDT